MIELLLALALFAIYAWRVMPPDPFADDGERRHG